MVSIGFGLRPFVNVKSLAATSFSVYGDRVSEIHDEAMAAILQVQTVLDQQTKKLDEQSAQETKTVRETLQSKVKELSLMRSRQEQLESEISRMQSGSAFGSQPTQAETSSGSSSSGFSTPAS